MKIINKLNPLYLLILTSFLLSCQDFKRGYNIGREESSKKKNTHRERMRSINVDSLDTKGLNVILWKIKTDSSEIQPWDTLDITDHIGSSLTKILEKNSPVWLETTLIKESKLPTSLVLKINQSTASEIYLNGKIIKKYGLIDGKNITAFNPLSEPFIVTLDSIQTNVLTVKLAKQNEVSNIAYYSTHPFELTIFSSDLYPPKLSIWEKSTNWSLVKIGIFLILTIIHFNFFRIRSGNSSNLYFALFCLTILLYDILRFYNKEYNHYPSSYFYHNILQLILASTLANIFFLTAIYKEFDSRFNISYYFLVFAFSFVPIIGFLSDSNAVNLSVRMVINLLYYMILILITIKAVRQKKEGIKIFATGIFLPILFAITSFFFVLVYAIYTRMNLHENQTDYNLLGYFMAFLILSGKDVIMAICLSLYISLEFTRVNKTLQNKLEDVDRLSKEKQTILESQNELLEKQVKARTSELQKTIETLKSTQDQLVQKEKLASLGELTAGIAHEIQNPLNFVNNFSELSGELIEELKELENSDDKELKAELLSDLAENQQKINHHGKRASNIVKGMLAHSRAASGERSLTNINELADEYLRLSFHGMRAKDKSFNADFKLQADPTIPELNIVPQDIGRVLLNLINNAFYSVFEKSRLQIKGYKPLVEVKTEKTENQVIIKVKDNGLGISDEVKTKVFQPFFTTKPSGEGTGLGLSLSYDIVTKGHKGELTVQSETGEYCEFIITLPIL